MFYMLKLGNMYLARNYRSTHHDPLFTPFRRSAWVGTMQSAAGKATTLSRDGISVKMVLFDGNQNTARKQEELSARVAYN